MGKTRFYEFVIFYENGAAIFYKDLLKNQIVDIDQKIENDRVFRNRM